MEPNPEQLEVIRSAAPHNLIVAGPGRGKTTCVALLALARGRGGQLAAGQKVLVLTFARQAVFHLNQTLQRTALREADQWLEVMTFHGFCFHLLASFGRYNGLKCEIDILSSYMAEARACEDGLQRLDFSDERTAVLSYDEVVTESVALLRASPRLRELYSELFPVMVVDEIQDTDDVQVELIDLLARKSQLFGFGDPAQHIYGFRSVPADRIDRLSTRWQVQPVSWNRASHRNSDAELHALASDVLDSRLSLAEILLARDRVKRFVRVYKHERPALRVYPIKSWLLKHRLGPRESNCGAILSHRRSHLEAIASALGRPQESLAARFNCQLLYEDSQSDMVEFLAHGWNWHLHGTPASLWRVLAFLNSDQPIGRRKTKAALVALATACQSESALEQVLAPWPAELSTLLSRTLTAKKDGGIWLKVSRKLGPLLDRTLHRAPHRDALKPAREELAALNMGGSPNEDHSEPRPVQSPVRLLEAVRKQRLLESVQQKSAPLRGLMGLTMHASKGKEFDHVLIVPETYTLAPAHFDQADHRKMWHVAITRTRGSLGIILPDNWEIICRRPSSLAI